MLSGSACIQTFPGYYSQTGNRLYVFERRLSRVLFVGISCGIWDCTGDAVRMRCHHLQQAPKRVKRVRLRPQLPLVSCQVRVQKAAFAEQVIHLSPNTLVLGKPFAVGQEVSR